MLSLLVAMSLAGGSTLPFTIRLRRSYEGGSGDDVVALDWDPSATEWPLPGTAPAATPATTSLDGALSYQWDFGADTSGYATLGTVETQLGGGIAMVGSGFPIAATSGYGGVGEPLHYARVGMTLNPGSLALYPERQSWSRANAYDTTGTTLGVDRPLSVFDDANCTPAIAFPKLSTTAAGGFSTDMLQRIEHYVLNDGQAAAPPCRLMPVPQGGQRFPHITPLSHAPGGDR